jgi:hypothetical protein
MHIRFARVALVVSLVVVSVAGVSHAARTNSSSLGKSASGASRPFTICTTGTDVISQNETWSATKASAYIVGCTVEVAKGATLAIEKKTVIKFEGSSNIYVAPGGAFSAEGCPQPPHRPGHPWHRVACPKQPIVFTTIYDNSVGGTTAPPGTAGSTSEYSDLVTMDGQSSVYIDYADVRHAARTIVDGDPLMIAGCAASGDESLTVTDSALPSPVSVGQCDAASHASHFDVSGDTFSLAAGTTALAIQGYPSDTLSASADRFDYSGSSSTQAILTNQVPVQGVVLAGRGSSTFSDHGPTTVSLQNGSVPAGRSWSFASPDGVELEGQIAIRGRTQMLAGARLTNAQLTLEPGGRLGVAGHTADPARFEDGSAISLTGSGALTVIHALFAASSSAGIYEQDCVADRGESARIEESSFAVPVQIGNCDSAGGDSLVVAKNRFTVPDNSTALAIGVPELNFSKPGRPGRLTVASNVFDPQTVKLTQAGPPEATVYGWPVQGIALVGRSANRFVGKGNGRVLGLTAASLPRDASWTASSGSGAVLDPQTEYYFGNPGLLVQGRLELDPGTIVKIGVGAVQGGGQGVGYGIGLGDVGTLVANGTKAHPVLFTSMNDSGAGGRSYGIPTSASQKGYEWAVSASEGSTVDVSDAVFRDGLYAFQTQCGDRPEPGGRFHLVDSVIQDEITLGNCDGTSERYTPVLQRDRFPFNGAPSGNFAAGGGYDPAALQPAVLLYNVNPTGVDLSGPESNKFEGKGAGRVVALAGTTIPRGEQWTISGSSNAVLAPWPDTDYLSLPGITVDGHLTLAHGATVKSAIPGIAIEVTKPGRLLFDGPASDPAVFTAISDDSVAGDSNGDGSASHPSPGAYGIAIQFDHLDGDMPVSNAVFRYAGDALSYLYMGHSSSLLHSDLVDNQAAIAVEETSGPDYDGAGNLPCVPPWFFGVIAKGDWFGPGGKPAPDIDISSFVGAAIPAKIPYQGTAFNISGVGMLIDEENGNFGSGDTVPWAVYSCAKLKYPFPLTAVAVDGTPNGLNYRKIKR